MNYPDGPVELNGQTWYASYTDDTVSWLSDDRMTSGSIPLPAGSGPAGMGVDGDGRPVVCCYDAHLLRDVRTLRPLARIPFPNDVVYDAVGGGVFVTSSGAEGSDDPFQPDAPASGQVYYVPGGALLPRPIKYANGLAVTSGGTTLLVAEHFRNRVLAYDIVRCGVDGACVRLERERVLVDLPPPPPMPMPPVGSLQDSARFAGPDGMCIFRGPGGRDHLMVTQFGAGRVIEYAISSNVMEASEVRTRMMADAPFVTNVHVSADGRFLVSAFRDAVSQVGALYSSSVSM